MNVTIFFSTVCTVLNYFFCCYIKWQQRHLLWLNSEILMLTEEKVHNKWSQSCPASIQWPRLPPHTAEWKLKVVNNPWKMETCWLLTHRIKFHIKLKMAVIIFSFVYGLRGDQPVLSWQRLIENFKSSFVCHTWPCRKMFSLLFLCF